MRREKRPLDWFAHTSMVHSTMLLHKKGKGRHISSLRTFPKSSAVFAVTQHSVRRFCCRFWFFLFLPFSFIFSFWFLVVIAIVSILLFFQRVDSFSSRSRTGFYRFLSPSSIRLLQPHHATLQPGQVDPLSFARLVLFNGDTEFGNKSLSEEKRIEHLRKLLPNILARRAALGFPTIHKKVNKVALSDLEAACEAQGSAISSGSQGRS